MGHDPDAGDAEGLNMVEAGNGSAKVADAVAVAVLVGADIEFVEYGRFVPVGIVHRCGVFPPVLKFGNFAQLNGFESIMLNNIFVPVGAVFG